MDSKPLEKDLEDIQVVVLGRQVDRGPLHLVLLVHDLGEGEIISVFRWQVHTHINVVFVYIFKDGKYIFLLVCGIPLFHQRWSIWRFGLGVSPSSTNCDAYNDREEDFLFKIVFLTFSST